MRALACQFAAVACFAQGPFVGLNDALGKQYLAALAQLTKLAQQDSQHTMYVLSPPPLSSLRFHIACSDTHSAHLL